MATVMLASLALAMGCGSSPEAAPERPRNVILVITDTLRADRLSCYGYERSTSPAIDSLAARGTRYAKNHSQGCWTVPSMISLMSGLYVTETETSLPPKKITLAETLSGAGIQTAAFVGNVVLEHDRGFQRGFDDFFADRVRADFLEQKFEQWYKIRREGQDKEQGFFAWIHPMDPHHPYTPTKENRIYSGRAPTTDQLMPRWKQGKAVVEELLGDSPHESFGDSTHTMNQMSNLYDGEVRAVDRTVERLLAFLEEKGILDETLIIFAADHGEMFFEHPHYPRLMDLKLGRTPPMENGVRDYLVTGHRAWFYEELWNTPLILAGPGVASGHVSQALSSNLDIYPTVLEALDVAPQGALDGTSLLSNPEPEREQVFGYGFDVTAVFESSGLKLIEFGPEYFHQEPGDVPMVNLYDQQADAKELGDLAPERPDQAERLRAAIAQWRLDHKRETVATTSEAALQALEDLGYLGSDGDQLPPTESEQ